MKGTTVVVTSAAKNVATNIGQTFVTSEVTDITELTKITYIGAVTSPGYSVSNECGVGIIDSCVGNEG